MRRFSAIPSLWKDRSNPPPDDSSDSDNDDCELEYDVYGWFNFDDDKEGVRRLDRQWVLLGSMNLDPRSARLNTEFGVRVRSFDLTQALLFAYQLDDIEGVYRVTLKPDGQNVQWVGTGDVNNEVLDSEPDSSMLTRLQLLLFSWFVPTDQL